MRKYYLTRDCHLLDEAGATEAKRTIGGNGRHQVSPSPEAGSSWARSGDFVGGDQIGGCQTPRRYLAACLVDG